MYGILGNNVLTISFEAVMIVDLSKLDGIIPNSRI
jgi:hypothetical protein